MLSSSLLQRRLIQILLVLVFLAAAAIAQTDDDDDGVFIDSPIDSSTTQPTTTITNIVNVPCSPNLREFTALTEMRLDGRTKFLELAERKMLKGVFMGIYNGLTTSHCDSYHRKVREVNFLRMSNSLKESYTWDANVTLSANENQVLDAWFAGSAHRDKFGNKTRRIVRQLQEGGVDAILNDTDVSETDVSIVYEVVGSCRDCPLSDAGAFELYDDSFRRSLKRSLGRVRGVRMRTRMLRVRDLITGKEDQGNSTAANADCICAEGVEPKPQAPGVQECVYLMNEELPKVAENTGLLTNFTLQTLIQLDNLSGVEQDVVTTPSPTQEGTMETEVIDEADEVEKETLEKELLEEQQADNSGIPYAPLDEIPEETIELLDPAQDVSTIPMTVARGKDHAALKYNIWGRG